MLVRLLVPLALAAPAAADELWLGVYDHDVTLAQTKFETGVDAKAGWIGEPIDRFAKIGRPAPHVLVSKSLSGKTDYVAAGLNWTFGRDWYGRPGIGLAVHNGPIPARRKGKRVDLGSPVTFEPEFAVGRRLNDHMAVELSWVHLSHAKLFSSQNRGMDSIGVRLLVRLP